MRSLKVKEGRVTLIADEENMEIVLDGVPVGRKFSPSAVTDLMRALFKLSEKVEGTMVKKIKDSNRN